MSDEDFFDVIDSLKEIIDRGKPTSATPRATGRSERDLWPYLYEISAMLTNSTVEVRDVLETVIDVALQVTGASRGFIILFDEQRRFDTKLARNSRQQNLDPGELLVSKSVVNKALAERRAIFIPNVQDDLVIKNAASVIDLDLLSAMCVPLVYHAPRGHPARRERRRFAETTPREPLGVLYVDSNQAIHPLQEDDLHFLEALANHATAAIINTRLYHQATTDPLSRLYTRRQFEILLQDQTRRAREFHTPLSLLMLDIDHFKRVNDRFGHPVGDEVIRRVAEIVKSSVRSADFCSRYGGEEFCIVLADTDVAGGQAVGEKIRRAVQEYRFEDRRLSVTVSIGVAALPTLATDERDLVKKADQALYRGKEGGRNRVEVWSDEIGDFATRTDRLAGIITGDFARDYRNVMMVLETIQAATGAMEVDELLVRTLDKVIEATGAERGAILLKNEADALQVTVARDRHGKPLEEDVRFSSTIPARVAETGTPVSLVDTLAEEERERPASLLELNLRQVMCVPLMVRGEIIGVMYADSRTVGGEMAEANLLFFDALARQVAFAIDSARTSARLEYERGRKQV